MVRVLRVENLETARFEGFIEAASQIWIRPNLDLTLEAGQQPSADLQLTG
jgi:hypothetical protein